jgi:hypothetical protein
MQREKEKGVAGITQKETKGKKRKRHLKHILDGKTPFPTPFHVRPVCS